MHFLSTGAIQEIYGFTQLCSANNGIVNKKQLLIFNDFRNRNLLHFCNQITHFLIGRSKRTCPSRSVFNEGASKRLTGHISITNSMRYTGVRNAGNIIHIRNAVHQILIPSHNFTVLTTHYFYINAFIIGVRITVVCPHECANPHFIAGLG